MRNVHRKILIIASTNPVKAQAALNAFQRMFPNERFETRSVSIDSGVGDQPHSNRETLQGARNRAASARSAFPEVDFWVGIEGGIEEEGEEITAFAWVVVLSDEREGKSRSGTFYLPVPVAMLIRQGVELGEADDIVFDRQDSKRDIGAVGILTDNVINRTSLYEQAVILALLPFKNEELYPPGKTFP